jgi:hypothetical protein
MKEDDDILDLPEGKEKQGREYFWLRMLAIAAVAYGLLAELEYWPGALVGLVAGVVLWTFWNFMQFFSKTSHKRWETAYFIGRLFLTGALFLQFTGNTHWAGYAFVVAAVLFLIGFLSAYRKKERS